MRRRILVALLCGAAFILDGQPPQGSSGTDIAFEVVGQVLNPSPTQSIQYGYLNAVNGISRITTQPTPVSESNALFTFYNDTATQQVINIGPMRVIDRTGTSTIYFDEAANNDFANADNFRKGTPVHVATLRHQVVIDTSSGFFTTTFENTIKDSKSFQIDGKTLYLGRPGQTYRVTVFGHLTTQGPPAAHIAGFASGRLVNVVPDQQQ
jgi:hypothetical protein